MRLTTTTIAAAAIICAASLPAGAHSYKVGTLEIGHPWSRATLPNAPVAGGYMTITNTGKTADRLLGGTTPAAAKVELHEMKMEGDVMTMRPLKEGLELPPGETVRLAPGGYHLMLMKPSKRFEEGERVPLTLTFEKAGEVKVDLAVDKPDAMGKAPDAHAGHNGHAGQKTGAKSK
ncbi:copper chaperone PCu(A)C [Jiella sonneratiae]|uniref:Copper chaperone PCu(A)C n=1 Tax=Jiella sonneratiae TaxID=2816856 RepID=A0ABS3J8J3_9HYPH|nr:copper chaperone PCu(A)C [Jiella sonneratiae]MBO0905986.1 copper chaperone PCu(A)C [Jiella sonneratiae]